MRQSTVRSARASCTSRNSYCSRYRKPPWISLVEADEVAPARSPFSNSTTFAPRPVASRAIAAAVLRRRR